jgi:hypothetical protein
MLRRDICLCGNEKDAAMGLLVAAGKVDSGLRIGVRMRTMPYAFFGHKKSARMGRFFRLAEREGFEPSIRLLTLYSLSRGAPSASRASLQNCFRGVTEPERILARALQVKRRLMTTRFA